MRYYIILNYKNDNFEIMIPNTTFLEIVLCVREI